MRIRHRRSGTFVAAMLAGAFVLAACGAGSDAADSGAAVDLPAVTVADVVAIDPAADIETNPLPDLVVDDLNADNKVNLRNYGVGDTPTLVWMWAPH